MAVNRVTTCFSEQGNYFAYAGTDGGLKILESVTGNPIADFTPNRQLTVVCSCMKWHHGAELKSKTLSVHGSKKKRRRTNVKIAVEDLALLALGMTNGQIMVYSLSKGELHTQLDKGHTAEVTDVCWNTPSLFTSSLDGFVIEWDLPSSHIKQKWKASNGGVHSISLCGSNRLLTADRSIKMWDLASRTVIQKFTGHSTEVFRLLPVLQQTSGGEEEGESEGSGCSYFVSAAANDRIVNVWLCQPGSSEKNAVASLSLPEEPADLTLKVTREQKLILSALTTKGKACVFEHTLNGKLKKPLKPTTVVHAATEGSREEVPVPVPIMAAVPTAADSDCPHLCVVHGSLISPRCTSLALRPTQLEIPVIVPKPEKKALRADFSMVKTPEVEGSKVLYPSHIGAAGPNPEPGASRRKRKKSVSELTVKERLEAMGVDGPVQTSSSSKPPKADQLVVQLTQGLQSNDGKLLTNAFQERNETTIQNTIKKLPLQWIHPLVKDLVKRRTGCHPQVGQVFNKWLQQIFCVHMAYIGTVPEIMETLQELKQFIQYRTHRLKSRLEVQNKLNAVLARAELQKPLMDEPSTLPEPLIVFQCETDSDESSDMEMEETAQTNGNMDDSDSD